MTPDVVVDVGNTRIKWGRCDETAVREVVSLPPDSLKAWHEQFRKWDLPAGGLWVLTSVVPRRSETLARWLEDELAQDVLRIEKSTQLPLLVELERPETAGIDRLLDAVAANSRRESGRPAVIIDAGSAVTVDRLGADGAFQGGAILPGFRLMLEALHNYTALLPRLPVPTTVPVVPGTSTPRAMEAGVVWTVVGGIRALIEQSTRPDEPVPQVFLTGGDGAFLAPLIPQAEHWHTMTLEGVRLAAEALP
jgi:type III pantothenate kinase